MSWVSIQEDIIKRMENDLRHHSDILDAQTIRNRCLVLLKEMQDHMSKIDGGDGHIAYQVSEVKRENEEIKRKIESYARHNQDLRSEIHGLKENIERLKKSFARPRKENIDLKNSTSLTQQQQRPADPSKFSSNDRHVSDRSPVSDPKADLVKCPRCPSKVKKSRLAVHMENRCANRSR